MSAMIAALSTFARETGALPKAPTSLEAFRAAFPKTAKVRARQVNTVQAPKAQEIPNRFMTVREKIARKLPVTAAELATVSPETVKRYSAVKVRPGMTWAQIHQAALKVK